MKESYKDLESMAADAAKGCEMLKNAMSEPQEVKKTPREPKTVTPTVVIPEMKRKAPEPAKKRKKRGK